VRSFFRKIEIGIKIVIFPGQLVDEKLKRRNVSDGLTKSSKRFSTALKVRLNTGFECWLLVLGVTIH